MLAGADIELHPVPGANDVGVLLGKHTPDTGLVVLDRFQRQRQNFSLARRPSKMGANVFVGMEFPAQMKNRDLGAVEVDDLAAGIGEGGRASD